VDAETAPSRYSGRSVLGGLTALATLVIARLAFHALFLPAYEGPDEPHHLGRIAAFADAPFRIAFAGTPLDGSIIRAVELRPCGPERHPCPPFGTAPGAFNLLHPLPKQIDSRATPNPENNQPPLFYLIAGLLLRMMAWFRPSGWLAAPDARLLWARLFSVALVALAILFPLRLLVRERPRPLVAAGLLFLLLPGASESLARCSNDAAVFCWAAFLVFAINRRAPLVVVCILLAIGPLLKLTAFPVAAFAIVSLWTQGRRGGALVGLVSACLVFPVQASRGWLWGGTLEFNRRLPDINESLSHTALGIARSLYTIVKTIFWLGGWSFFRAPALLVIAWFLLLALFPVVARFRGGGAFTWPHAAGAAVALLGCAVFIVGNRRFYGDWGGVGGWYVWGWAPWVLIAFDDLLSVPSKASHVLLSATAAFVAAANADYFLIAFRIYA
jgi:hypothetical protein